jgi:ATP-dependent protease ClpP protease subunit/transcription elongation factor Elf1
LPKKKSQNQKPTDKKFVQLTTKINNDKTAELWIYGTITEDRWMETDVSAFSVVQALNGFPPDTEEIIVHINSYGGDVFEGVAIYQTLRNHNATIKVIGEGIVGSIASVIAMAGDSFSMTDTCMLMVHNPSTLLFGAFNQHELDEMKADLERVRGILVKAYAGKTGMTDDKIIALLDGENGEDTYLTPEEALELGFCDDIIAAPQKMIAMLQPSTFICRGKTLQLNIKKPSTLMNGGNQMPKGKVRTRPKAELLTFTCPSCQTQCTMDTDTSVVTMDAHEYATVAVPDNSNPDYQARNGQKFVNEKYKITCPNPECKREFDYDTTPGGEATPKDGNTHPEGNPVVVAKTKAKVKNSRPKSKPKARAAVRRVRMEIYPVHVECPECEDSFDIDVDGSMEEVIVTCPSCGAELDIYTENVGEGEEGETYNVPEEDVEVYNAMRQGMINERKRIMTLQERAKAFPQFANAIEQFIESGTSVETVNNWIFKAMASDQGSSPQYLVNAKKDAAVLNRVGNPTRVTGNQQREIEHFNSIAQRRGTIKNA